MSSHWTYSAAAAATAAAAVGLVVYHGDYVSGVLRRAAGAEHAPPGPARDLVARLLVAEANAAIVLEDAAAAAAGPRPDATTVAVVKERAMQVLGQLSTVAGPELLPSVRRRRKAAVASLLAAVGEASPGGPGTPPTGASAMPGFASRALTAAADLLDNGAGAVSPGPDLPITPAGCLAE